MVLGQAKELVEDSVGGQKIKRGDVVADVLVSGVVDFIVAIVTAALAGLLNFGGVKLVERIGFVLTWVHARLGSDLGGRQRKLISLGFRVCQSVV